jgi:hypothetical protein
MKKIANHISIKIRIKSDSSLDFLYKGESEEKVRRPIHSSEMNFKSGKLNAFAKLPSRV